MPHITSPRCISVFPSGNIAVASKTKLSILNSRGDIIEALEGYRLAGSLAPFENITALTVDNDFFYVGHSGHGTSSDMILKFTISIPYTVSIPHTGSMGHTLSI